jgi:hypothetical protein
MILITERLLSVLFLFVACQKESNFAKRFLPHGKKEIVQQKV